MKILFLAAELFPYVKVGGLGDVMAALPRAIRGLGADVRLLLPGYPALREALPPGQEVAFLPDLMGGGPAHIRRTEAPGLPLYLLHQPAFFERPGGPYEGPEDSARRFAALGWAAAHLSRHGDAEGWRPDVLHGHDWPAGLAPAYLAYGEGHRPRTVMTVHNIAFQGRYPASVMPELRLPPHAFNLDGVEFNGDLSFLKAGLHFSDRITTVSPTYAQEIQVAGGHGFEGLLSHRRHDLTGILNGVDKEVWNPARDPNLLRHYDQRHLARRDPNKPALQRELGLHEDRSAPLFAAVTRLDILKGLDLLLENLDHLVHSGAQLALLGRGNPALEAAYKLAAARHPGRIAMSVAHDEGLAHRIFAGADLILVPSRQEPCGLTQLYAQAYGALPLVRRTGGLADTVVAVSPRTLAEGTATGFMFLEPTGWALGQAIDEACALYRDEALWRKVQRRAMAAEFGWEAPARAYLELYASMLP